jgi:hypothetical protein
MEIQRLASRSKELEILNNTLTTQLDKSLTQETSQYTQLQHSFHTLQLQHHSLQEKVYLIQQQYEQSQLSLKQLQKELLRCEETRALKERLLQDTEMQLAQQKEYYMSSYDAWLQEKSSLQQLFHTMEEEKKSFEKQLQEQKVQLQQEIADQLPQLLNKAKESYAEQWQLQHTKVVREQRQQFDEVIQGIEHEKEEERSFWQQKEKQWSRKLHEKEHVVEVLQQKLKYAQDDYALLQNDFQTMKQQVRSIEYPAGGNAALTNGGFLPAHMNATSTSLIPHPTIPGVLVPVNLPTTMPTAHSINTNLNTSYQLVPVPPTQPTAATTTQPPPAAPSTHDHAPDTLSSHSTDSISSNSSNSNKQKGQQNETESKKSTSVLLDQTNISMEYLADQLAQMKDQLHATLNTPNPFQNQSNMSNSGKKSVSFAFDTPPNTTSVTSNTALPAYDEYLVSGNGSFVDDSTLFLASTQRTNTSSSRRSMPINDENDPYSATMSSSSSSTVGISFTSSTPSMSRLNTSVESIDDVPTFEHLRTGGYYEGYWKAKYQKMR